jgi:MFS family permease
MKWSSTYYQLLFGLGISQLGNWIYLIALNVYIWQLTESPAAVALLYMIAPAVRIASGFFVGSYIDRWDKKKIVVASDIARGIIVCLMPFAADVWLIYVLVAFTNVAGTFFGPSSTYLITKIVRDEDKKRFNAVHSTLNSGSFTIGPALGGAIIAISSIGVAMWINGLTFFICAAVLAMLPKLQSKDAAPVKVLTFKMIKEDWHVTLRYAKQIRLFSRFVFVYSVAMMIAYSLDSQEMAFLVDHLHISETLYSITVSVTGIGAVLGGIAATYYANKWSVTSYVKVGFLLSAVCYLVFYASNTYVIAVISFTLLGVFMAFCHSGYATLYQTTIDPDVMGRFGSMINLIQGVLQIAITLIIGLLAEWFSIQFATVLFAVLGVLLTTVICMMKIQEKQGQAIVKTV